MTDLTNFGFEDNTKPLYCRKCGDLITKVNGAVLLGTPVRYGVCHRYSHGVTIMRT